MTAVLVSLLPSPLTPAHRAYRQDLLADFLVEHERLSKELRETFTKKYI